MMQHLGIFSKKNKNTDDAGISWESINTHSDVKNDPAERHKVYFLFYFLFFYFLPSSRRRRFILVSGWKSFSKTGTETELGGNVPLIHFSLVSALSPLIKLYSVTSLILTFIGRLVAACCGCEPPGEGSALGGTGNFSPFHFLLLQAGQSQDSCC